MQIGAMIFATDVSVPLSTLAPALEERGYDAILVPERTHTPLSRRHIWNGGPPLTPAHHRTLDPFVSLTVAAMVTTRLRLVTAVCLITQRDPINVAKAGATLDLISGGRFELGVGYGWHAQELADHGVDARVRAEVGRERLEVVRALWTQEEASFEGRHVHLSPSTMWPKPLQQPHPPILLGAGPAAFDDVIAVADGWMPYNGFHDDLPARIGQLRRRAESVGRDPATLRFTVLGVSSEGPLLEQLASIGVDRVAIDVPSAPTDIALAGLERHTERLSALGWLPSATVAGSDRATARPLGADDVDPPGGPTGERSHAKGND